MADYYPLLAKAVSGQAQSTPESRRAIYERARKALLGQLRNMTPPVPQADVDRESEALDEAIRKLEAELSPAAPAPEDAPSAAPAVETPAQEPPATEPPRPESAAEAPPASEPPARPRIEPKPEVEPAAAPAPPPPRPPRSLPPLPPIPPRVPTARPRIPAPIVAAPQPDAAESDAGGAAPALESVLPEELPAEPGPEEPQVRIEGIRPIAPQPRAPRGKGLRYGILALVILLIVGGIAALAIKLKDRPEDILRARPQAAVEPADSSGKIVERIGAGTAPTTPPRPATAPSPSRAETPSTASSEPPQPVVPVAQRAAMLVDAPDEPQKFKTYIGSVVWRLENVARGPGQPLAQAVRAEADIPDAGMRVSVLFQRNTDDAIPASHMMTVSFTPTPGGPFGSVDEIDLPQMRNEVAPAVDSVFGVQAKITQNMFLVGFAKDPTLMIRNVDMLRSRGWLDIPMRLADGRIAKVTLEKGPGGDRAIADAFASWGQ